ncbi:MAG: HAD family phosphatase [Acidimicrobiales bacterium]
MRSPVRLVVFDFDGVVRHHDSIHEAEAARAVQLAPGQLASIAFQRDLLSQMVEGGLRREDWIREVGQQVGAVDGVLDREAAVDVVARWLADWGWVDPEMLAVVQTLRDAGHRVALLTNGTDTTDAELVHHRVDHLFDPVFNSWHLGVAKPDPRVFQYVTDTVDIAPNEVTFFDDTLANVTAAQGFGWRAHHVTSVDGVRRVLRRHGLLA